MNKKNGLEEFIRSHRSEFDTNVPSDKLWSKISEELGPEKNGKNPPNRGPWMYALAVLFMVVFTAFYFYQLGVDNGNEENEMLFAELSELEHSYDIQAKRLINMVGYNSSISENVDINEIDQYILEIKSELEDTPIKGQEKALKALQESYKTKLMIIQNILINYETDKFKND